MSVIRVVLPYHLRNLARVHGEMQLHLDAGAPTLRAALESIEAQHPQLRGAIRDRATGRRRPFIRFFACKEDFSDASPETLLPPAVMDGREPLLIVGAMAGG